MKTPKQKLKPSWEMHDRILWDPKLNPLAFYIGYEDRMIKDAFGEKLLIDWASNDIPWNRVQYIRCADTIVWDRAKRIDLFEAKQLPSEAFVIEMQSIQPTILINGIKVVPKPTYVVTAQDRKVISSTEDCLVESLKLASFNLLTDKYHSELIQSETRQIAIVQHLLELDADIILLQEVDAPMLEKLLQANWKQPIYSSDIKRKTGNYYQELVILSKYPFSWMEFQYSTHKKFPIASWQINGQAFHLANVHLSSNRAADALVIRQEQLNVLLNYFKRLEGTILIGGDFNSRGKKGLDLLEEQDFTDCWSKINPTDKGYTFEPSKNPLAMQSTLTGLPARFDRFYIRSKNTTWEIEEAYIFANQVLKTEAVIFPSDHYGLAISIAPKKVIEDPVLSTNPWSSIFATYHSAIVIIPDENTCQKIQNIRQQFDRKHKRWMPHITLLYGFLPDRYFEQAANELSTLLKNFPSFDLELKQYKFFAQKSETSAWLEPLEIEKKGSLKKLQKLLQDLFMMKSRGDQSKKDFTPHLSIGQFRSEVQALEALPPWEATGFKVGKIALISRCSQDAFNVRYTIDLESGTIKKINKSKVIEQNLIAFLKTKQAIISFSEQEIRSTILEVIQSTCNSLLGQEYQLKLLGSSRLGTNSTTSDLDILATIPKELDSLFFLEAVQTQLEGWYESARLIRDAQVPILKLQMDGISVDLLCVEYPTAFISMDTLSEKNRRYFSPQNWQAVTGILEAESILEYTQKRVSLDTFQWFVKAIKIWASSRAIKGNAFGFLGTYSWTILAAWVLDQIPTEDNSEDASVLMTHFFSILSQYDWAVPIAIIEEHNYNVREKQDRMPILTSIRPYYNSARNITRSTAIIIQREFQRGHFILKQIKRGKNSWTDLYDEVIPSATPDLSLVIQANNTLELQEACGWIEGHIVSLIIALEQIEGLVVRPYPSITIEDKTAFISLDLSTSKEDIYLFISSCFDEFKQSFDFDNKVQELKCSYNKFRNVHF
jgi:poly(A) polymerase Pap1/2'-5' RNA ligase/endonuclease/exonuclease/phosphatase family metal-dependent hydrolase